MTKRFLLILIIAAVSSVSFGQTTTQKLEQVKNDPQTTQNAAKADVKVLDNKNVTDKEALRKLMMKRREQRLKRKRSLPRKTS